MAQRPTYHSGTPVGPRSSKNLSANFREVRRKSARPVRSAEIRSTRTTRVCLTHRTGRTRRSPMPVHETRYSHQRILGVSAIQHTYRPQTPTLVSPLLQRPARVLLVKIDNVVCGVIIPDMGVHRSLRLVICDVGISWVSSDLGRFVQHVQVHLPVSQPETRRALERPLEPTMLSMMVR